MNKIDSETTDTCRVSSNAHELKILNSKKIARQESKRKKLAALLSIRRINIKDKFYEGSKNMASLNLDEPCCKKIKKNETLETDNFDNNEKLDTDILDLDSLKSEYKKVRKFPTPKLNLRTTAFNANVSRTNYERVPLILTDIQHLLLHTVLGSAAYSASRWYKLDSCKRIVQTTCLVIEGISLQHWLTDKDILTSTETIFPDKFEVLTPSVYNGSLIEELAAVPLSEADKESLEAKYGTMDLALESRKDLMVMMKAVFPMKEEDNANDDHSNEDKFSRTKLILSAWQLIEENYPVPLKGKLKNTYSGYLLTKDEYKPVTSKSPMFGLDCEMCITNAGSELTRISIVNEKHEVIYETYVKPYNTIVNYLTHFSGITKSILKDVTTRLEDVQEHLRKILPPDAILVGQSLNIDLHALKMMHPYIIDTSIIFNISGNRSKKSKLKVLAKEFLNETIQDGKNGHCSVEDSLASLKLVQLKLSKSIDFGDAVLTGRIWLKQKRENQNVVEYASTIFNHIIEQKKTSIIIGCDDITGDYHSYMMRANEFSNTLSFLKKGKAKKVKLSTVDKQNDVIKQLLASVAHYNFAMGHLKLDMDNEDSQSQFQKVDGWIDDIWKSLPGNALFVVIFGGTSNDNGIAMVKIKTE
ncbi:RNA exonuclease 5 [Eumeta japonica]|uniref:RNA exonuclease 5 n=1 Tax=Eumeta variegata TaxID=151549 RepID=A0A4C1YVR0_EUMVA|nr:RNA exonuclease 5 [Eumeta japonica]